MITLKIKLHGLCLSVIKQRMENAQQTIQSVGESAGEETKSSAGDKYETSREMMQQETDRAMAQLTEANRLLVALNRIGTAGQSVKAEEGSIVKTNNGNFYMAISAGSLTVDNESFFAISAASPIGIKMAGCIAGDTFSLNGKAYTVSEVL